MIQYKCDKKDCEKIVEQSAICQAIIVYERTGEEVEALYQAQQVPNISRENIRKSSVVKKQVDLCKDCYNELKENYFYGEQNSNSQ